MKKIKNAIVLIALLIVSSSFSVGTHSQTDGALSNYLGTFDYEVEPTLFLSVELYGTVDAWGIADVESAKHPTGSVHWDAEGTVDMNANPRYADVIVDLPIYGPTYYAGDLYGY